MGEKVQRNKSKAQKEMSDLKTKNEAKIMGKNNYKVIPGESSLGHKINVPEVRPSVVGICLLIVNIPHFLRDLSRPKTRFLHGRRNHRYFNTSETQEANIPETCQKWALL